MLIRPLDPSVDLDAVEELYRRCAEFWMMTDRRAPDRDKARAFFTDCPPNCDPAASHRLGLFVDNRLQGLAELSFGWPAPGDAFIGLQLVAPEARGQGHGIAILDEMAARARDAGCPALYLAVVEENTKARAFWESRGFQATGVGRFDDETGHRVHRLVKPL